MKKKLQKTVEHMTISQKSGKSVLLVSRGIYEQKIYRKDVL